MSTPRVLRPDELRSGPPTPGIEREEAFSGPDRWVGRATSQPGVVSGWHHHGQHDTYFFVLAGAAHLEFAGGVAVDAHTGDFVHVPAGVIHRESTLGDVALDAVVIRLGSGPHVVDVPDPDPPEPG